METPTQAITFPQRLRLLRSRMTEDLFEQDGLRRLAGRQYPAVVRVLAAVLYVSLTVRLVQAIALFQGVL